MWIRGQDRELIGDGAWGSPGHARLALREVPAWLPGLGLVVAMLTSLNLSAAAQEVAVSRLAVVDQISGLDASTPFGEVSAVTANAGGIWVLDRLNHRASRHSLRGDLLAVYGGTEGSGPGELSRQATTVVVLADGSVVIPDPASRRVAHWEADGTFLDVHPFPDPELGTPTQWGVCGEDLIVEFTARPAELLRGEASPPTLRVLPLEGGLTSTVFRFDHWAPPVAWKNGTMRVSLMPEVAIWA